MIPQRLFEIAEVREHLTQDVRHWAVPLQTTRSDVTAQRADGALDADGDAPASMVIEGYAAVFDADSLPICGMFTERIKRGAFKKVLATNPDVKLLVNHTGLPYARTTNGSLTLAEKPQGLYFRAELAPTEASEDLYALVERADVDQNSFAFRIAKGGDSWDCPCGDPFGPECSCSGTEVIRTITEMLEVPEVSVVTFPAYPTTTVTVARESEPGGERRVQAGDEDQPLEASPVDASTQRIGGDHATHIRAWLIATGSNPNESRTERGARAR